MYLQLNDSTFLGVIILVSIYASLKRQVFGPQVSLGNQGIQVWEESPELAGNSSFRLGKVSDVTVV